MTSQDIIISGAPRFERMTAAYLTQANRFASHLIDNRNFHHFRHTMPEQMLNDKWEVYLMMWDDEVIAWGQIEKFPGNPHKVHVCRLGFAVLPQYRGMSLGGRMMDHIINCCQNYQKLTATVFLDNVVMLNMFINRGFVIEGCFIGEEKIDNKLRNVVSLAKFNGE